MNVALDIDCISEEAPAPLILKPMKAVMMFDSEAFMKANLDTYAPSKAWLLARMERFERIQKIYFSQMFQGED
jgi:hypothetical protein